MDLAGFQNFMVAILEKCNRGAILFRKRVETEFQIECNAAYSYVTSDETAAAAAGTAASAGAASAGAIVPAFPSAVTHTTTENGTVHHQGGQAAVDAAAGAGSNCNHNGFYTHYPDIQESEMVHIFTLFDKYSVKITRTLRAKKSGGDSEKDSDKRADREKNG